MPLLHAGRLIHVVNLSARSSDQYLLTTVRCRNGARGISSGRWEPLYFSERAAPLYRNDSITRSIAGCFRSFTLIQSFDRPA